MLTKLRSEPVRTYVYGVTVPVVVLLVLYGILDESAVADWLALATAVLMPAGTEVARSKVTPVSSDTDESGGQG